MANIICYKKFDKIFSVLFFLLAVTLWQGNGFWVIADDKDNIAVPKGVIFNGVSGLTGIDEIVDDSNTAVASKNFLTAAEHNYYGNEHYAKKEFDKAIENYQKAIDLLATDENKKPLINATLYSNIGLATMQLNNLAKAFEWHQKALAIREKELGKNHPDTANSYNNIGIIYSRQGDYDKAEKFYTDALNIYTELPYYQTPAFADICNNIGVLYYKQKKHIEALESLTQAYKIYTTPSHAWDFRLKTVQQNLKIVYNYLYKNSGRSFNSWSFELQKQFEVNRKLLTREY
ncbi:MAG: tetratricopeptide repeat protein [Planctomycetaceae bacterium]|jgi:tetratricopeptide (TPR) repeat protein|nr:tetratricopeptide repeat protein [Planctomycetaceae bacterium]